MTSSKKRFAFYVSGSAKRLILLLEKRSLVVADTCFVINDGIPNPYLSQLLSQENIPYLELQYDQHESKNECLSRIMLEKFNQYKIDYAYCFGSRLLTGELITVYKNRIINFHPSILPMFPGFKAIDQALESRTILIGNTAHFIDEGADTGPIIMQSILHKNEAVNYETVLDLQIPMIEQIHEWIMKNRVKMDGAKVQIEQTIKQGAVFFPKIEQKIKSGESL